jgi:hypothetical protein
VRSGVKANQNRATIWCIVGYGKNRADANGAKKSLCGAFWCEWRSFASEKSQLCFFAVHGTTLAR